MSENYQEQVYEMPRPTRPLLWIGLTAFFALCCCFFFVVAGAEAVLLFGSGNPGAASPKSSKPAFGEIKFYLEQSSAGQPSGAAVTAAPANTKTVYAYFTYSNMPKTGLTWAYLWALDGTDLPSVSKKDQRWTKEGNGTFFVKLTDDKGLKSGDYDLSVQINGVEAQFATIHVGP